MAHKIQTLASVRRGRLTKAALVLLTVAALAACTGTAPKATESTQPKGDLVIGALLGLTGIAPTIGEAARVATTLAADEINKKGGIDGRHIKLVIADSESNPTKATLELGRLLNSEGAKIIIGPMFSQESFAVLPEIAKAGVFNIHMTADDKITPDFAPYSFGILMNAQAQATKMAKYAIAKYAPKSVVILHDPGSQAISGAETLKKALTAAGVTKIVTVQHAYGVADMTPYMLQVAQAKPDVILLYTSTGGDLGHILAARKTMNLMNIPVVASNVAAAQAGAALAAVGGDESVFTGVTGLTESSFATCKSAGSGAPVDFQHAVEASIGKSAAAKLGLVYASLYYDAVHIIKDAVEGSHGATDGKTLTQWMYKDLGGFKGVNSPLSASPTNHFLVGADSMDIIKPLPLLEGGMEHPVTC
jgi:branched-chain amino acid transport system substrate-binding protein